MSVEKLASRLLGQDDDADDDDLDLDDGDTPSPSKRGKTPQNKTFDATVTQRADGSILIRPVNH